MARAKDGATLLRRYMEQHELTLQAFAERLGSTGASVSRWVSRRRVPGIAQAMEIERATRGAVPVEAWARVQRAA